MTTLSGISARTSVLVVRKFPHLDSITCKIRILKIEESPKRLALHLEDGNLIQVYECGPLTALWFDCPPDMSAKEAYCRLGPATSVHATDVLMCFLDSIDGAIPREEIVWLSPWESAATAEQRLQYIEGDGYDLSEISELLQKGCRENVSTLQRFLERVKAKKGWKVAKCLGRVSLFFQRLRKEVKAKKRWRMVKCLGRVLIFYQRFREAYYAPPEGRGYLRAKCDFSDLMNSRFRAQ